MYRICCSYCPIARTSLLMLFVFLYGFVMADNTQDLISPASPVTIASNAGDAAPSAAYNSDRNEYFLVYSDQATECSGDQVIKGQVINSITGQKTGNEIVLTACGSITNLQIVYNNKEKNYLILYNKIKPPLGAEINYLVLNGSSLQIEQGPTIIEEVPIGNFYDIAISVNSIYNIYTVGYHKENALGESSLILKFINGSTNSILNHVADIDKSDFNETNQGIFNSKLLSVNSNTLIIFEVKFTTGSEIYGVFIDPDTNNETAPFQISPDGNSPINYRNPSAALNTDNNEVLVVYEQLWEETYSLNYKIHGQKINGNNGSLISPINTALTTLPVISNTYTEETKLPAVAFSGYSREFVFSFYGVRFAAGDDEYNIYLQRVEASSLNPINNNSIYVINEPGSQVIQNDLLRSLSFTHNTKNNQFLLGWNTLSANAVQSQVWRYDNNLPINLDITVKSQNENLAIGTTFSSITANDPDPEDANLVYTFINGVGGEDNAYFSITGNALKIAQNLNYEASPTRNVKIKATDSHGQSTEQAFALAVKDVNEKPQNLALSGSLNIDENLAAGTFTSDISVEDEDQNDTHTYSLIPGDGDEHNGNFMIETNSNILTLATTLNYEETPKQFVRIRATDQQGLFVESAFVITVNDLNEEPEDLELSAYTFPENDAGVNAAILVIDPDGDANYLASKTAGEGDDDNDLFVVQDNILKPLSALDYESKSAYKVRLKASDGTYEAVKSFTLSVADINEAPDTVILKDTRIETDSPAGSLVGTFETIDQDDGDTTHTYTLIEGTEYFFNNGPELHILSSLTYDPIVPENNFYTLTVRSTDSGNAVKEVNCTVEVVLHEDDIKPEINGINDNPSLLPDDIDMLKLKVTASDNEKLDSVFFFYRPIRSEGSFTDATQSAAKITKNTEKLFSVDVELNANLSDEMGIEYYFVARDAAGNADTSAVNFSYRMHKSLPFTPTGYAYDGVTESYRIISNPFDLEPNKVSKIFADYGSSTDHSWRLFAFPNGKVEEIGIKPNTPLQQGHGYWFNKTAELNELIELNNAQIPEYNQSHLFQITLQAGWNLIGNPYPFDLNWRDVLSYNNIDADTAELFTYDKNYQTSDVMKVFEGGYVFVNVPTTIIFPLVKASTAGKRIADEAEPNLAWAVNFSLDNGKMKNELGRFGMHPEANDTYDGYDRPALPNFINQPEITFSHSEHPAKLFSGDIVKEKENYTWEFFTSTGESKTLTMAWSIENLEYSQKQLLLYDITNDVVIDMKNEDSYIMTSDQPTGFKAIYGDQSYIAETLGNIKAEALTPYPNPFKQNVSLPVNLPQSKNNYELEYNIYDLTGNLVFEKKVKNVAPGLFNEHWESNTAKGIYIYKIKVSNGISTNHFRGRIVKN